MRRSGRLALFPLAALVSVAAAHAAAPPPSNEPPEVHAARLLEAARAAAGGAAWDKIKALHVTAKIEDPDGAADEETWLDPASGRMVDNVSDGPLGGRRGYDGKTAWTADLDGTLQADAGPARDDVLTAAWWRSAAWARLDHGRAAVAWQRDLNQGGRGYQVILVTPKGGAPFELWLDRGSHLPARLVEQSAIGEATIKLSDWRRIQGVALPWHVETDLAVSKLAIVATVGDVEAVPSVDAARFAMPSAPPVDYLFPAGTKSVELSMKLLNGHVHVEARIGKVPLDVMFDTAAGTSFDRAALDRLNLLPHGTPPDATTVRLPAFGLGGVQFRHQLVALRDLSGLSSVEGVPVGGVLGYEIAKRLVVELDYDGRRMVLVKPEVFVPPSSASPVALSFAAHVPLIDVRIDGIPARLAIDTASAADLTIDPRFASAHGLATRWHVHPAILAWNAQGAVAGTIGHAGSLEIGVLGLAQPLAVIPSAASLPADGALGGGALRRFDVVLDYRHSQLWLQQNRNADQSDHEDRAGLWINRNGDALVIAAVLPKGPAARVGLRPGDLVVSIDGDKAETLGLPDLRARFWGASGTAISLGIRRGDTLMSVRLVLGEAPATPETAE